MVRIEAAAFGAGGADRGGAARERGGLRGGYPRRSGRRIAKPTSHGRGGRLVVCPTPIGNLEDVTLRVLSALRDADVVACEDTRRTRVLLERYGVQASLVSYHEHNERERAAELVERMRDGAVVALVSDAGMPLVSDPGYVLVQGCVAAGLEVEVLPGPSAALAALVAVGAAVGRVAVRRLPAAQAVGADRGAGVARDGGRVRVAQARGGDAGGAGGSTPSARWRSAAS